MKAKELKRLSKTLLNVTKAVKQNGRLFSAMEPGITDLSAAIDTELTKKAKKTKKKN